MKLIGQVEEQRVRTRISRLNGREWIETTAPAPIAAYPSVMHGNVEDAIALASPTRVPVVGTAQLGDNGFWSELEAPTGYGVESREVINPFSKEMRV